MSEALRELMRHAFETLGYAALWCGWFDGNVRSERVQKRCGFRFVRTAYDQPWPLTDAILTEHFSRITREEWSKLCSER